MECRTFFPPVTIPPGHSSPRHNSPFYSARWRSSSAVFHHVCNRSSSSCNRTTLPVTAPLWQQQQICSSTAELKTKQELQGDWEGVNSTIWVSIKRYVRESFATSIVFVCIMEFIETCRGGKKICLNGYMYVRQANKTNRIRWQCSNKDAYDCKGALTTSLQVHFCLYKITRLCIFSDFAFLPFY